MADAQLFELGKISSLRIGAVGADGAMATLTASDDFNDVLEGTINLAINPATESFIMVETSDEPIASQKKGSVKSFTLELMGLKLSQLPLFIGGTFTPGVGGTRDTYEFPTDEVDINLAVEFNTQDRNAGAGTYQFTKCAVLGSNTGTFTKDALRGLELKFTVLQPYTDAGVKTTARRFLGETIPA